MTNDMTVKIHTNPIRAKCLPDIDVILPNLLYGKYISQLSDSNLSFGATEIYIHNRCIVKV